jgi:hypothetical protein
MTMQVRADDKKEGIIRKDDLRFAFEISPARRESASAQPMNNEEGRTGGAPKWTGALDRAVAEIRPRLVEIRRHLHRNPEPSGAEVETTRYLRGILCEAGIESRLGPEGRGAVIDSATVNGGGRVALRGDIDALFIQDAKECDYRSRVPGVMHACGHDAHAACLVGSVLVMEQLRRECPGPCRGGRSCSLRRRPPPAPGR